MLDLLGMAGPVVALGLLNFLIVSGAGRVALALIFGKRIKALRLKRWISTIPGNPSCLDPLLAVTFGSFPELNDFSSILPFVDLSQGPVVLRGMPPHCRYWSLQAFLAAAKSHKVEQCLRDKDVIRAMDGSYTVVLSSLSQRPAWATPAHKVNWIPVPEGSDRCSVCLRAFCVTPGETFRCPDVWFMESSDQPPSSGHQPLSQGSSTGAGAGQGTFRSGAEAIACLGPPEPMADSDRTGGQWAAQGSGHAWAGARHHRLGVACWVNGAVLVALDALQPRSFGASVVAWGALAGLGVYWGCMAMVARRYRKLIAGPQAKGQLKANQGVLVPDPNGDLKGHPKHLYYTIAYDATNADVKVCGVLRGGFAYTSVTCYDWHSLPPAGGFRSDESLVSDAAAKRLMLFGPEGAGSGSSQAEGPTLGQKGRSLPQGSYTGAAKGASAKGPSSKEGEAAPAASGGASGRASGEGGMEEGSDRFVCYLTTRPTFGLGLNEIDVGRCPAGVCLVRLVYPESDAEIARCTPTVSAVAIGDRAPAPSRRRAI